MDLDSASQTYDYMFKVVAVGDSGVGKTNLISRFTKGVFSQSSANTIGVEFTSKLVDIKNAKIKVQIWDTAGQERFRAISVAYYRSAVGGLVVYDLTKRASFVNIQRWLDELRNQMPTGRIILIGNKVDMADEAREVSIEEGKAFAEAHKLGFVETSAKTSTNVEQAFIELISEIFENKLDFLKPSGTTVQPTYNLRENNNKARNSNQPACCNK